MSENRKRDVTLTIRLTAAEKDAIVRNAAKARTSLTDYIVASSLLKEIYVAEDTRPLISELKRIGNNLKLMDSFTEREDVFSVVLCIAFRSAFGYCVCCEKTATIPACRKGW